MPRDSPVGNFVTVLLGELVTARLGNLVTVLLGDLEMVLLGDVVVVPGIGRPLAGRSSRQTVKSF